MVAARNEKKNTGLAQRASGSLSKQAFTLTIGGLEQALLKKYPVSDAEAWDRTGLSVGDPIKQITRVAVALDPTVEVIYEAKKSGANVVVTHHPAFLSAPETFRPGKSVAEHDGALVWAAIEQGVALMAFHTALDVNQDAARVLPGMLSLTFKSVLDPLEGTKRKGYGQLCTVKTTDAPLTLEQLSARCMSVFAKQPRVWGDFSSSLTSIVTCTGSVGDLPEKCLAAQVDCLVCGEVKYHDALAASQAGLAIIEVGHDTSELPLAAVLAASVESAGVPKERVIVIDQGSNWACPETIRM